MYKNYRLLSIIIAVLMSIFIITSCKTKDVTTKEPDSNKENTAVQKTEISYWCLQWAEDALKPIRKIVKEFNDTNDKNIVVKFYPVPPTGGKTPYDEKLIPAIVAGAQPDIIMNVANQPELVSENLIEDITEYIEADKSFSMDIFYPVKKEECYWNDRLYSLPWDMGINGFLMWNKSMFKKFGLDPDQPPMDLKQLDSMAERMFVMGENDLYETGGYIPWAWLAKNNSAAFYNARWRDKDGKPTAMSPRMIEYWRWVDGYIKKYGYDRINKSFFVEGNPLIKGNVGMTYAWIGDIEQAIRHEYSFEWSIARFPTAYEDAEPMWLGGFFLSICKGSKHPKEAVEFIKFMCGERGQTIKVNEEKNFTYPVTVISVNQKFGDRLPVPVKYLVDSILPQMTVNEGGRASAGPNYSEVTKEFTDLFYEQKGDVVSLLEKAQKRMDFIWEQYNNNK